MAVVKRFRHDATIQLVYADPLNGKPTTEHVEAKHYAARMTVLSCMGIKRVTVRALDGMLQAGELCRCEECLA